MSPGCSAGAVPGWGWHGEADGAVPSWQLLLCPGTATLHSLGTRSCWHCPETPVWHFLQNAAAFLLPRAAVPCSPLPLPPSWLHLGVAGL